MVGEVRAHRQRRAATERHQTPRPHVHRRARLEDPHHVQESLSAAEIGDQEDGRGRDGAERDLAGDRRERWSPATSQASATNAEPDAIPAKPEVARHLPAPHRRVNEWSVDIRDRRAAHPPIGLSDLPGSRLGARIAGVASRVQKRPLSVAEVRARERDGRHRLGCRPRRRGPPRVPRAARISRV